MQRILLRHLSGSKANQVEDFPVEAFKEITLGRDPASSSRYDPERDDLVSKNHAKITLESAEPLQFAITDVGSRNGTLVNNQRAYGAVKLNHGDLVQLGPGGPTFRFEIEPPPLRSTRPAEEGEAARKTVPPTREATTTWPPRPVAPPPPPPPQAPLPGVPPGEAHRPVGKATVERMLDHIMAQVRGESQRRLMIGGVVLLALIVIVGAVLLYARLTSKPPERPLSAEEIARRNGEAVVFVDAGWKLIDTSSGRQLYHVHFLNEEVESATSGKKVRAFEGFGERIPLFTQVGSKVQPLLTGTDGGGLHKPIGGQSGGSGFVVRSDGFLLTNRHLAAAWETPYVWPADTGAGLLVDDTGKREARELTFQQLPKDWVPVNSAALIESIRYESRKRLIPRLLKTVPVLEGRFDYLDVVFARTKLRTKARLVRSSDRHDVALIKVDLPQALRAVEINTAYGSIGQGARAVVLAYPATTLGAAGMRQPKEAVGASRVLPDPAVDEGHVVTIHKSGQPIPGVDYAVELGESYELSLRSMGGGSSGGPVFDERGRVFALLYGSRTARELPASYAVPISYGAEIMNLGKVAQ